ncbi:hypothetical protein SUDANB105_07675 [Streptomyces sp. enrichment culture]
MDPSVLTVTIAAALVLRTAVLEQWKAAQRTA